MRQHTQAGAQAGPAEGKPPREWAGGGGCHSSPGHSPDLQAVGQILGGRLRVTLDGHIAVSDICPPGAPPTPPPKKGAKK